MDSGIGSNTQSAPREIQPNNINTVTSILLNATDIRTTINLVSRLQHIDSDSLMLSLLYDFESLLDITGVSIGIYNTKTSHHICISSTNEDNAPIESEIHEHMHFSYKHPKDKITCMRHSIFSEKQDDDIVCYVRIETNEALINDRQRHILQFILPYLYSAINRLHLITGKFFSLDLTIREQEVMHWIVEGKDNWSISQILGVSERTIKFHNCNIYKKLGVSTKAEVICLYYKIMSSLRQLGQPSKAYLNG